MQHCAQVKHYRTKHYNDLMSWTSSSFLSTFTTITHLPILKKWISLIFNLHISQKIAPECGNSCSSVSLKFFYQHVKFVQASMIWGWDKWLWKERMNTSCNIFQCVYYHELLEKVYLKEKLHDIEHSLADVCLHEKQDVD